MKLEVLEQLSLETEMKSDCERHEGKFWVAGNVLILD